MSLRTSGPSGADDDHGNPSGPATLAELRRCLAHISAEALAPTARHSLRSRDRPMTPAMNSANRGLSDMTATMINHCAQIDTLPMR